MARIAQGDAKAFERLYQIFSKPIGAFLYRLCYDKALAEDCLQEVFMRLWKAAPGWRGESKVSTFLFQIAKNYGLNARDKATRERARFDASPGTSSDADEPSPTTGDPAYVGHGPEEHLAGAELHQLVREAVERLPEDQRLVVHLAQTEGLTYREVAEILKVPLGTVKSRMASAADALRRKLERHVQA